MAEEKAGIEELRKAVMRLVEKVKRTGIAGECWMWIGAYTSNKGKRGRCRYGQIRINGKYHSARRMMFRLFSDSPIQEDRPLDAVCGYTLCVNPSHMVAKRRGRGGRKLKKRYPWLET